MAVECTSEGEYAVTVTAGGFELRADEPERLGGTGTGPNPVELLLASVGACTAITIVDAARERGLPLGGVRIRVRHKQNTIPRSPGDPSLVISEIRREVELEGDLTAADREWLFERGCSCPVSRSLEAGLPIRAELRA